MTEQKTGCSRVRGPECISHIAKDLGLPFYHFSEEQQMPDPSVLRDPGNLILLTGTALECFRERISDKKQAIPGECDAVLKRKHLWCPIDFTSASIASMTKFLRGIEETACSICYEPARFGKRIPCNECFFPKCMRCTFKLMFEVHRIHNYGFNDSGKLPFKCPQCRETNVVPLFAFYFVFFDDLWMESFSDEEKRLLMKHKSLDNQYHQKLKAWNELKRLKVGSRAQIHGMQNRKDLNEAFVKIVGKSKSKNNQIRWPVRLLNQQHRSFKTVLLVKMENLEVHCDPLDVYDIVPPE